MKNIKKYLLVLLLVLLPIIVLAYPKGDVTGDNRVNSTDYIAVRKHILKQTKLTGDKFTRADLNNDNKITSLDYIAIRKLILNNKTTNVAVIGVTLNKTSLSLEVGKTATLTATVSPSNATNKEVTWATSNSKIATVDANGKVKAIASGETYITVRTKDGEKKASCKVTISKTKSNQYTKQFDITFFRGVFARYLDDTQAQYMKDANFTLVALEDDWNQPVTYEEHKGYMQKALRTLDKYGLRANVYDWMALSRNLGEYGGTKICEYTGNLLEPCLKQMLNDYSSFPNVYEYYVKDEPSASSSALTVLKNAIDYIRKNDPGREGYINLLPNYAGSAYGKNNYLIPFISYVKPAVLSVDHYPQMFAGANVTSSKNQYYENLKDIYDVSETYNVIPMMITLVTQHASYKNLSRAEIAYQVSVSLAFGMKRISYFTYSLDGINANWTTALLDKNHNRTQHYYDVQSVNKWALPTGQQLFSKKNLGVYGFNEVSYLTNYNAYKKDITATKAGLLSSFNDHSYMLVNTEILPTPTNNTFTFQSMDGLHYFDTNTKKWVKINGNVSTDSFAIYKDSKQITIYPGQNILLKGRYWDQDASGNWYYREADGTSIKNNWIYDNGYWYYLGADGIMYANTTKVINGTSYHFNEKGVCDSYGC